ncbi:MAG: hypothetical protein ACI9HK_004425, partial [Pirellulaceae bacterium]
MSRLLRTCSSEGILISLIGLKVAPMFKSLQIRSYQFGIACLALAYVCPAFVADAQEAKFCVDYRIVYKTIHEPQEVTVRKVVYETVVEDQEITETRPVWVEETRERRYKVLKPFVKTGSREERHTVLKPVTKTVMQEQTYSEVRYVDETATRQERYIVNKPVVETQVVEERHVVSKPITETIMQDRQYTSYDTVTTYRPQVVDQGQWVDQTMVVPGGTRTRLRWLPNGYAVEPLTGAAVFQRGGLYWVPEQGPAQYRVQRQYVPNVVTQQVPMTSVVPKVVTEKRPVEITRYVDEVVTTKIPVQVTRMRQVEEVRNIPYTVRKRVVQQITKQVPVEITEWERTEVVRKVPTKTYEYR